MLQKPHIAKKINQIVKTITSLKKKEKQTFFFFSPEIKSRTLLLHKIFYFFSSFLKQPIRSTKSIRKEELKRK